jgi:hypothetical protein
VGAVDDPGLGQGRRVALFKAALAVVHLGRTRAAVVAEAVVDLRDGRDGDLRDGRGGRAGGGGVE